MIIFITARKRSLGQSNVFTPVCHSGHWAVCLGWGRGRPREGGLAPGGLHPGGLGRPPPHRILQDTVNEWAVRILLECILVWIADINCVFTETKNVFFYIWEPHHFYLEACIVFTCDKKPKQVHTLPILFNFCWEAWVVMWLFKHCSC